jgi:multidrug efflux pump subunit AcrA (membrane-fusion protein)
MMGPDRMTTYFEARLARLGRRLDRLSNSVLLTAHSLFADPVQNRTAEEEIKHVSLAAKGQPAVRIKGGSRMFTVGVLTLDDQFGAITLPRSAVGRDEQGAFVFKIEDGYLRRQDLPLQTLLEVHDLTSVGDLSSGDVILSVPLPQFVDGTPIFEEGL